MSEMFTQMCLEGDDCPFIQWSRCGNTDEVEPDGCWLERLKILNSYEDCRLTPLALDIIESILSGLSEQQEQIIKAVVGGEYVHSGVAGGYVVAVRKPTPDKPCPPTSGEGWEG